MLESAPLLRSMFGFCALIQIAFLPGFLLVRARRWSDGALQTFLLSFALSLLINFYLVALLVALRIYITPVVLGIFFLELAAALAWPRADAQVSAGWTADIVRITRFGEELWQGSWLVRVVKLAIIVLAAQALLETAREVTGRWGDIFSVWDEVTSWNKWALNWAANQWPDRAMSYPQLLPANISLTYLFLATDRLWMFAKGLMPFFPVAVLLLLVDLALRTRRFGFVLAIIFTAYLMKTIIHSALVLGYADGPLTFLIAMGLYACILKYLTAPPKPGEQARESFLVPILAAAAALTKITGWFACVALALLAWRWRGARPTGPSTTSRWIVRWLALAILLPLPWYIFSQVWLTTPIDANINAYEVLTFSHRGRDVAERMAFGLKMLVNNGGLTGVLIMALSLTALASRTWRWPALLGGAWYLIWSLGMSYDTRNLAPAIPFLGIAAGLGVADTLRERTRGRILLALLALLFGLTAANKADALFEQQAAQQETIGNADVNRMLFQYLGQHGFDGKIISNYNFMPFIPRMKFYYAHDSFHDLEEFRKNLESFQARYILVNREWCNPVVHDFIKQKIQGDAYAFIDAIGPWHFIRMAPTNTPIRGEYWLAAEELQHKIGHVARDVEAQNGWAWEVDRHEHNNFAIYGPYLNLPPGSYRVSFRVKADALNPANTVALEVTEQHGCTTLGKLILDQPTRGYEWQDLNVTITGQGVEFRCWKSGAGNLRLDTIRYQRLD
ncbi:MAG: hypothetical protein L6437_05750 [Kiritimatiellae bacterium]|nr:hypothetical protein [Verrucomicrobiota bacterium]MBU4366743.1 hypothetical protein [Verrucomicrobiota bacterium]MCG2659731.1 hypothetical protein [Kiritimatiellia bacterium]